MKKWEKIVHRNNATVNKPYIVHFTVTYLITAPLKRSEAKADLVRIQTLLLFKCKLLCYHGNQILVSITTRSPSASLQIKGLETNYTTVKWPIKPEGIITCWVHIFGTKDKALVVLRVNNAILWINRHSVDDAVLYVNMERVFRLFNN